MRESNTSQPDARFIEALSRHQPALEAFCHANLGNREDARDALQNACVTLWQKASTWDPETAFLPWAFTVTRFTILSLIRDKARDRIAFDEEVVHAMARETESASSEFADRCQALNLCLAKLKAEQRALLEEHYVVGRTLRSIAAGRRRSESAVKMAVMRLRLQLSTCIQRQMKMAST